MKRGKGIKRRLDPHADCPFTAEELDLFKAALYSVNTSFHCANPAPVSWVAGYQRAQLKSITPPQ